MLDLVFITEFNGSIILPLMENPERKLNQRIKENSMCE
jgi:hypothetical protein